MAASDAAVFELAASCRLWWTLGGADAKAKVKGKRQKGRRAQAKAKGKVETMRRRCHPIASAVFVLGFATLALNPGAVLGRERRGFREWLVVSKRACVTAQAVYSVNQYREVDQYVWVGLAKRDWYTR